MFIKRKKFNEMQSEIRRLKANNEYLQHDCLVMLENSEEQRRKITDLENNIEMLYNNLTEKNKKLARPN